MKAQLIALALVLSLAPLVASECCSPPNGFPGRCDDGSLGTPCCGVYSCNIFCCNCDGGCRGLAGSTKEALGEVLRHGNKHAQSVLEAEAPCHQKFKEADADGDGKLTFLEWVRYSIGDESESLATLVGRWEKFDVEGKGYLTEEQAFERRV